MRANGRLKAADVERGIVEGVGKYASGSGGKASEKEKEAVYLKATGRAIPRALEMGVYLQGQGDCVVRVETGSVRVVDDVEVIANDGGDGGGDGAENLEVDGGRKEVDVPETRVRTLSSVTVSVRSI
jgi:ribonuclease P/MRP protein subunit POP7